MEGGARRKRKSWEGGGRGVGGSLMESLGTLWAHFRAWARIMSRAMYEWIGQTNNAHHTMPLVSGNGCSSLSCRPSLPQAYPDVAHHQPLEMCWPDSGFLPL